MKARIRAAFTLVELLTVIAIIALLISILLPSLGRAREMAHRTGCLANQAIIMKGALVYAKEADGKLPNWGQQQPGFGEIGRGWDWDGNDNAGVGGTGWFGTATYRNAAGVGGSVTSNTRNYYILVRKKLADTKNFQCHSDPDWQGFFSPADPNRTYDFQYRGQVSFSMQYQGPGGDGNNAAGVRPGWQPSVGDDPRLVILADKSPLLRPNSPIQANAVDAGYTYVVANGTGTDAYDQFCQILSDVETNTGTSPGDTRLNPTTGQFEAHFANPDDKQALNSQNHKGEGQNLTRLDGSGGWAEDPWQGAAGDNIYTVQDGRDTFLNSTSGLTSRIARACGAFPTSGANPANEADVLTYWLLDGRYSKTVYPDSFLVP